MRISFVDDMAQSSGFALENTLPDYLYNVGTGEDLTIKQLAETIRNNNTRRNHLGLNRMVPRKLMDISKMHACIGMETQVQLEEGIQKTYNWFDNIDSLSK
jgi:GDP-L-fucose synthase